MKYTGRIIGTLFLLANSLIWINHQAIFHHDPQIGPFEIIISSLFVVIGWWLGKIYDGSKLQNKIIKMNNKKLEYLSNQDGLTGIANRRYFDQNLVKEWEKAIQHKIPLSLILFDVDFFKEYNDTYGHLCGDDCLKKVASTIKATFHEPNNIIARFGGEEFAIILPNTPFNDACMKAEHLRVMIESIKIPHSKSIFNYLTISVGVACITPNNQSKLEDFVNFADYALYQSKQNGRNRIFPYNCDDPIKYQKSSDYNYV